MLPTLLYEVIDTETTIKGPEGGLNRASAFWRENRIVLLGYLRGDLLETRPPVTKPTMTFSSGFTTKDAFLVGHNLKFDVHHLRKAKIITSSLNRPIWDTQLAEYILTGQQSTFASLDELAVKYGGTLKDSEVSDMFAQGIGADEIDRDILEPYLRHDLTNTELVFLSQFKLAVETGMLPLIMSQMGALRATIEMSWNGFVIDQVRLQNDFDALEKSIASVEQDLQTHLVNLGFPKDAVSYVNLNSTTTLAAIIFGGTINWETQVPAGVYKTGAKAGLPKFKTEKHSHIMKPMVPEEWVSESVSTTPTGKKKVDATTIETVLDTCKRHLTTHEFRFLTSYLLYKEQDKQLNTYYRGVLKSIYDDGKIHQDLNHCVTATGRLASAHPNMQNITNGPIKAAFVSRWGANGNIVEIDYGQLEVLGLACVTKDPQLIKDIKENVDIHTALYTDMYGKAPTSAERKAFKPLTFGLIYGAGVTTLAAQGKVSKATANTFIKTFYTRYPEVKAWHTGYTTMVQRHRKPSDLRDEDGIPVGIAEVQSALTGRKYVYKEYKAPEWMRKTGTMHTFSPTELKNYSIQGLSTGDIVPLMLGEVFSALMSNERLRQLCLMINTVHDSLMFDIHDDVLEEAIDFLKEVLQDTPKFFTACFGKELPFDKFEVKVSVGKNWLVQFERS